VPKREDERRRRNKNEDGIETTTVKVDEGPVKAPDVDTEWHPIAQEWFSSLRESAQSRFYEPSDWATAKYIAEAMSKNLKQGKISGQLFAAVMSAMTDLLTTEGARRRARMEIERGPDSSEPAGVTALNDYRKQLGL